MNAYTHRQFPNGPSNAVVVERIGSSQSPNAYRLIASWFASVHGGVVLSVVVVVVVVG